MVFDSNTTATYTAMAPIDHKPPRFSVGLVKGTMNAATCGCFGATLPLWNRTIGRQYSLDHTFRKPAPPRHEKKQDSLARLCAWPHHNLKPTTWAHSHTALQFLVVIYE